MRDKYWDFYTRTKFEMLYFNQYLNDSYRWLRYLEGFLAVASCGSIAAWAVWSALPVLWSVIIAASQVAGALKQYLPYGKRIAALNLLIPRLDALLGQIDHEWFRVDNGELGDAEINDIIFRFRKECVNLNNRYLTGVYFPAREDLKRAAQAEAECYFDCF